jgi:hypothetical protein
MARSFLPFPGTWVPVNYSNIFCPIWGAVQTVGFEIDILILHVLPQLFNKGIVHPAALAVHVDGNVLRLQRVEKDVRSKLTALIRVKDFRTAIVGDVFFQCFDTK